ncbi:hypothetical protein PGB90_004300 [Kerria lacca]
MLLFLNAICLWSIMITLSICKPFDGLGDSFSFDKRLLDEDPQDKYNKTLASKSSTMRNDDGFRTSRMPPSNLFPSTSKYPAPSIPDSVDAASHPPINRGFFTPPLPKDQFNFLFADRPTLRGSNSENTASNKRPLPPPLIPKTIEKERIPILHPDLVTQSDTRKKTINTPSVQKLPEGLNYSEPSSSPSSTTHRINDTYQVVVPVVHNISVTSILRLLNNGNKHDYISSNNKPRLEPEMKIAKTHKEEIIKNFSAPTSKTTSSSSVTIKSVNEEDKQKELPPIFVYPGSSIESNINHEIIIKEQQVTEGKNDFNPPVKSVQESTEMNTMTDHSEPRARYISGIAWDIHVYLIAILFAILACMSAFSLLRMKACKWLLPYSYFFSVHCLLAVIGAVRSIYLFYDAYNKNKSFSEPIRRLMENVVFPFLVCIFSLMFLFILKIVDLKADFYYARKSNLFLLVVIVYALFSMCIDLYADRTPYSSNLIFLSQCLFVFLCVILGVAYIAFYKYANRSSLRKQNSVYGTAFTDPLRPSLAHAIRVMLATSLLSLLMAAIQVIGMFCVYDPFHKDQPHPWLWWAFQLSIRVIEVSICFLIFWAAVQPFRGEDEKETQSHNSASGFPLFPWGAGGTPRGSDNGNGDDIYPTICNANQAVHNYTLRTGKQVYEDIFQYNASSHSITPVPMHLLSHTTDRRSFKRHPLDVDPVRSACGTLSGYPERRPQPSPSMLIDEKGIVRFRSIADAELHQGDDTFSRIHLSHPNDNYSSS